VLFGKLPSSAQLQGLQSLRFAEFNSVFDYENRLATAVSHVNVNRTVIIAVEKEPESLYSKHLAHGSDASKRPCTGR